ncbi:MAG: hypothetical protein N3D18_01045 [Roseococcus sp.]|nr:hypothetical protein [Roseococcus sp.]
MDFFNGGAGRDRLISDLDGETDTFLYYAATEGLDTIWNFEAAHDRIALRFLDQATMSESRFVNSRTAMTDTNPWIIYDAATGRLMVDLNGTAAGQLYQIATLIGLPELSYGNFEFGYHA